MTSGSCLDILSYKRKVALERGTGMRVGVLAFLSPEINPVVCYKVKYDERVLMMVFILTILSVKITLVYYWSTDLPRYLTVQVNPLSPDSLATCSCLIILHHKAKALRVIKELGPTQKKELGPRDVAMFDEEVVMFK